MRKALVFDRPILYASLLVLHRLPPKIITDFTDMIILLVFLRLHHFLYGGMCLDIIMSTDGRENVLV